MGTSIFRVVIVTIMRQIGSARLDNAVFRNEAEPYQACRDGRDFALMRCGDRHNRFTRPERGTQLVVLVGAPGNAMPEWQRIGRILGHLSRLPVCERGAAAPRTSIGMLARPLV
jgi:hypothetical protein